MRGGSAWDGADGARAAYRFGGNPGWGKEVRGFRVALPAVPELAGSARSARD